MTTTLAPTDDLTPEWMTVLIETPAELLGTVVYRNTIREISAPDAIAAARATAEKIARRLPGVTVDTTTERYLTGAGVDPLWCETHRTIGCREAEAARSPFADAPAPCWKAPARAVTLEVVAHGLPMFDGAWSVGGILTRDQAGAVVAVTVGGLDLSETWARERAHLAGQCVHCGLPRNRAVTVLLLDGETGEVRPVGRTCLGEYTGGAIRAEVLGALTGMFERFAEEVGGVLEGFGPTAPTVDVVALAMRYIALEGFISQSGASGRQVPTAENVRWALTYCDGKRPPVVATDLTDADRDAARAAIAVVLDTSTDTDRDRESGFLANLREVAALDWAQVGGRRQRVGLLAALPSTAARRQEAQVVVTAEGEPVRMNAYIGEVKQRREFTGRVVSARVVESEFGVSDLVIIDTEEGTVKVLGKAVELRGAEPGAPVRLVGTISGHGEWRGHRQTRVQRVKVLPLD